MAGAVPGFNDMKDLFLYTIKFKIRAHLCPIVIGTEMRTITVRFLLATGSSYSHSSTILLVWLKLDCLAQ